MKPPPRSIAIYQWFEARLVWHPLLFAVAPMLSLMGHNLLEIDPRAGTRVLFLLLITTASCLILLQRRIADKQRAALLCSLSLLLFFSYGHVYYGLVSESTHGLFARVGLIGNHLALSMTWFALFAASLWITSRSRLRFTTLTQVMNLMALVTVSVPLIQITRFEFLRSRPISSDNSNRVILQTTGNTQRPDFYYIILDGYGGQDILRDLYSFDNRSFLGFLEQEGFSIASQARSNYVQTSLSISSSLNMTYLETLLEEFDAGGDHRLTLSRLIRDNRVMATLEAQGYESVAFASGYRPTELRNADRFFSPPRRTVNPLEGLLLETSAFTAFQALGERLGLPGYYPGYASHRELIHYTLSELPETADLPGPKIVFAHIVIPHPPFVFEATGQPALAHARFSFMDGDAFQGTEEQYRRGYREQLAFLNDQLQEVIHGIIQRSSHSPVIILQGDHGPGLQLDYQSFEDTNLDERSAILYAVRFADGQERELPPGLTPVNTFRVIFDTYFNADLGLLPDRSFYSPWNAPLDFVPIVSVDVD